MHFLRTCRAEYWAWVRWQGQGRLLDFGCGGGRNLARMHALGWQVKGMDFSRHVAQSVKENFGLDVVVDTLPTTDLSAASFEVVTMWNSLEHVPRPSTVLKGAAELLVPGGKLYATVPNFASWGRRRYGEHWFPLDVPRHLTHFTPATIRTMFEAHGFVNVRVFPIRRASALRKSARNLCRTGQGGLLDRLLSLGLVSRMAVCWLIPGRLTDLMLVEATKA